MLNINTPQGGGLKESGYLQAGKLNPAKRLMFLESLADFQTGRLSEAKFTQRLQENMSTSDFPLLFADIVDREVLMGYQERTSDLSAYIRFTVNSNFNPRKLFAVDGGEGVNEMVKQLAPYPEASLDEAKYEVSVDKYGSAFAFSFENYINDGLGLLADSVPRRMGKKCRRTEETVLTKLFATDTAIASLFTAGNKNIVTIALYGSGLGLSDDNTPLSLLGVIDAYKILSMQVDADGQPITTEGATVVYPSHMQPIVDNIKNALSYEFRSASVGTGTAERIVTTPYLAGQLNWVPNAQLAIVGGTNKMTGWFMFANPRTSRPAIIAARLRGHEQPELFMKASNAVQIGGGEVNPFQGSFENDSMEFKCRQFIGGATIDPKAVVYSNGTGSA